METHETTADSLESQTTGDQSELMRLRETNGDEWGLMRIRVTNGDS